MSELISLRNPHSIQAAIEKRPESIRELLIPQDAPQEDGSPIQRIWKAARTNKVRVESPKKGHLHAKVVSKESSHLGDFFGPAKGSAYPLYLALDSIQDPQNLGAIFRSASFFGVSGVIFPKDRASGLTSIVYDVSCGGVEAVPHCEVSNLRQALEEAKKKDYWILGTSEHSKDFATSLKRDRPWVLVLGNEENGMRRLVQEACDMTVAVPPQGYVTSLNVSVACGVLLAHLRP